VHPAEYHRKLVPIPLVDKNTVNPLVAIKNLEINKESAKRTFVRESISKPKLKLDSKKLKFLKEYNNKVQDKKDMGAQILNNVKEEGKAGQQKDLAQVVNELKLRKHSIDPMLEGDVLMDSISTPHSPQIESQEYYQINRQSPFSEVVDKRVSEYLGNKSFISKYRSIFTSHS
jgi:hypothetical protein